MARSKRKTPIFGMTTATSEKQDKRHWNRIFRRVAKRNLETEREIPKKIQAVTEVWSGAKDGKRYYKRYSLKDLRK